MQDMCLGSKCTCTPYPVHIKCFNGHPDILKDIIKRVAVSMEINGDTIDDLLVVDLNHFISLKTLDLKIYHKDVCFWVFEKRKIFHKIQINGPDFCELFERNNANGGLQPTNTEKDIYIKIKLKDAVLAIFLFGCVSACGFIIKCLR